MKSPLLAELLPFASLLRRPETVRRALKVSAIVGTILVLINQGDAILGGQAPILWKLILTYITPYAVSSYSTASLLRDQVTQTPSPFDQE